MSKFNFLWTYYPTSAADLLQAWKSTVVLSVLCTAYDRQSLLFIRIREERILYVLGNHFYKWHVVSPFILGREKSLLVSLPERKEGKNNRLLFFH